jgi:hypothetical protein
MENTIKITANYKRILCIIPHSSGDRQRVHQLAYILEYIRENCESFADDFDSADRWKERIQKLATAVKCDNENGLLHLIRQVGISIYQVAADIQRHHEIQWLKENCTLIILRHSEDGFYLAEFEKDW